MILNRLKQMFARDQTGPAAKDVRAAPESRDDPDVIAGLKARQYSLDINAQGFVTGALASSFRGVSDDELRYFTKLPHLKRLVILAPDFNLPQFTDQGLAILGEVSDLEELLMGYNPLISDDGLRHISKLTRLRILTINNTEISDVGLVHLKELTGLRLLNVRGTRVTSSGVAELKRALPNCDIDNKR